MIGVQICKRLLNLGIILIAIDCLCISLPVLHSTQSYAASLNANYPTSYDKPKEMLINFYHWYLNEFVTNRDPLHDNRATMEIYVTDTLLKEIDRRYNSPDGLEEDYFIKAQDYLNDWLNNVVVTIRHIKGSVAYATVTLGTTEKSKHRLTVELIKKGNFWKIRKVARYSTK
ncbi:MAG: DUF3828 domain-containing protein [Syntrophobacteraceae bacterium]